MLYNTATHLGKAKRYSRILLSPLVFLDGLVEKPLDENKVRHPDLVANALRAVRVYSDILLFRKRRQSSQRVGYSVNCEFLPLQQLKRQFIEGLEALAEPFPVDATKIGR